jgi:hypothetical protein
MPSFIRNANPDAISVPCCARKNISHEPPAATYRRRHDHSDPQSYLIRR